MKSDITKRSHKGFSLVELCIVMAVIAIAASMVISFCTLVSYNVNTTLTENELQNDYILMDTVLDRWVSAFDSANYIYQADANDTTTLYAIEKAYPETKYKLQFKDGTITGELPDGSKIDYAMAHLETVSFVITESQITNKLLINCTVNYAISEGDNINSKRGTRTFLKATHISHKTDEVLP